MKLLRLLTQPADWQKIWYITLPCIKSTIVVVLIMTMGNLFGGGLSGSNFQQCYLLGNSVNAGDFPYHSDLCVDVGLSQGRYAYATAVGLIQSVISLDFYFRQQLRIEEADQPGTVLGGK